MKKIKKELFLTPQEYQSNDDDLNPMTAEQAQEVLDILDSEGFDYGLRFYSSFDEIDDPSFHNLRVAYCDMANKLENYLKERVKGK